MIQNLYKLFFGDFNEKYIKQLYPILDAINSQEEEYQKLTEEDFLKNTEKFQKRLNDGETVEDLLVEAFATVKNACRRLSEKKHQFVLGSHTHTWNMVPYDVQLIGGIVLHRGQIAEMKTGEGKTLVSVSPVYLNALTGKGVHVITVNDYLAERDAAWMGQVFEYLGIQVGILKHGQSPEEKRKNYACDVTYGTNNEFGFDYLRDNMAVRPENQVMNSLAFAIVDEVDSILIDEARTPLIISAPAEESTEKYSEYARLIKFLEKDQHYIIDEKEKNVSLTEEGIEKMEELLGVENIYTDKGVQEVHHIEAALKAQAIFRRDIDYVVRDGEILIVDEFTGRLMPGRRFSGGLHQAIEAKEKVEVRRESRTLASITFQNFFRLYDKLAGMTGTAATEAKEFGEIYALDTIVIPTNKTVSRIDKPDAVFKNAHGKYQAIIERVKQAYKKDQPVLIGTISIERSEILSSLLSKEGISHNVLNAKHHEKEAEIISRAGEKGAVTIATNMAGRGTDIKLTQESYQAGGLLVIGTERHESRRIDNQLRGRSGRQGDPGETQFFVSMDDDLMRIFGSDRIKKMMETMGIPDDMPIENKMITNAIESAQKKVEARNFEIRKHILQYDNVMNKHREIIYTKRNTLLHNDNIKEEILTLLKDFIRKIVQSHVEGIKPEYWNYDEIAQAVSQLGNIPNLPNGNDLESSCAGDKEAIIQAFIDIYTSFYEKKEQSLQSEDSLRAAEKAIYLRNIDTLWMDHIDHMMKLRETVALRAYANKNPLFEYQHEAFEAFKNMSFLISVNTVRDLMHAEIHEQHIEVQEIIPTTDKLRTNADQIESSLSSSHILPTKQGEQKQSPSGVTVYRADREPEHVNKVGRNEPCPCGSGKKYKKCCGS